jgi:hypothetical protein
VTAKNNRHKYACLNVDYETFQKIRALAHTNRRSLLNQVRAMADAEHKKLSQAKLFDDEMETKA